MIIYMFKPIGDPYAMRIYDVNSMAEAIAYIEDYWGCEEYEIWTENRKE